MCYIRAWCEVRKTTVLSFIRKFTNCNCYESLIYFCFNPQDPNVKLIRELRAQIDTLKNMISPVRIYLQVLWTYNYYLIIIIITIMFTQDKLISPSIKHCLACLLVAILKLILFCDWQVCLIVCDNLL